MEKGSRHSPESLTKMRGQRGEYSRTRRLREASAGKVSRNFETEFMRIADELWRDGRPETREYRSPHGVVCTVSYEGTAGSSPVNPMRNFRRTWETEVEDKGDSVVLRMRPRLEEVFLYPEE